MNDGRTIQHWDGGKQKLIIVAGQTEKRPRPEHKKNELPTEFVGDMGRCGIVAHSEDDASPITLRCLKTGQVWKIYVNWTPGDAYWTVERDKDADDQ